jgi:outer membrane immunogenic protein
MGKPHNDGHCSFENGSQMTMKSAPARTRGRAGLAAALCALTLTAPAAATDLSFLAWDDDASIGPLSWTGFIFNPDVGYDTLSLKANGGAAVKDAEGWRAGLELGYDYQIGGIVVGFAADGFYSWLDSETTSYAADLQYYGTLRARLGYTSGRYMAYATGGWAFADLEISDRTTGVSDSQKLNGWAAGGGVEYKWNKMLTARVEYVRVEFGEESFASLPASAGDVSAQMDLIKFGLISRF